MLPKSANYTTIWNDPSHYAETKLVVGGTTYGENVIMGLDRTQTLFADYYNIGNTVMGQIQFSLTGVTAAQLPRMSRVEVWTRLWSGDGSDSTDWLPMGVYYTGKPEYDTEAELLSVTAYDEMYKTGVVPFEGGATVTAWDNPTLRAVAEHIIEGTTVTDVIDSNFAGIGLELEDPTQILDTITMPSIPYNFTVREIMADIAIACCGNWTMVFQEDNGSQKAVFRLVKNVDWAAPTTLNLGRNVTSFEKGDDITPVTSVYVYYGYDSNGASVYGHAEATPNDGREYEVSVQTITDGTQANLMASQILAGLGGTFYHPYSATGAELDPATELGDTVTINSITSIIGAISCSFNRGMWADISAEGLEPVDDFDYLSGSARQADRIERSAEINSAKISVNTDAINAEVTRATSAESDMNESLRSTITQTANDVTVTLQSYAQDQVNNHAVEQQQYIRYSASGLELGQSGTMAKAVLTNTKLEFQNSAGATKAYIGQDPNDGNAYKFFVINGHIVNQLELGDHWLLVASGSENSYRLTFKWKA